MSGPSLQDQADFVRSLLRQTRMVDGSQAETTHMTLGRFEVSELEHIAKRLERMAPHEDRIRKMVAGR